MRLALYQPEIPQNTGTLIRLTACLNVGLDIIHPCGYVWNDQRLRRAGMDYLELAKITHHDSFEDFVSATASATPGRRLILLDTKAPVSYTEFSFDVNDTIILGRESSGVPASVAQSIPDHILIPMRTNCRSLNMAVAAAMVLGESCRQTGWFEQLGRHS